jgi:hypothetical protein
MTNRGLSDAAVEDTLITYEIDYTDWDLPHENSTVVGHPAMLFSYLATPITAPGGEYKLCWCSQTQSCTTGKQMRVNYGELYVIGPSPLTQSRTCTTGQTCIIDGYAGNGIQDGDQLMVRQACDDLSTTDPRRRHVAHFPGNPLPGITMGANDTGTTFYWNDYVTAGGGRYRLCWCASVFNCTTDVEFTTDSGILTLIGPNLGFDRTCKAGTMCGIVDIDGVYLKNGDLLRVLDTCGTSAVIIGWPRGGTSDPALFGGQEFVWGGIDDAVVTAAGGFFRMCWCSNAYSCVDP